MSTITVEDEVTILARFLENEDGELPPEVARYILEVKLKDRDKARMHDLAVRNQQGHLSSAETEEMFALGRATTLLSIMKSTARRTLGIKATRPTMT